MQLQQFLPASRRVGDADMPFLLRQRSSKWFIMMTISIAIFTVCKIGMLCSADTLTSYPGHILIWDHCPRSSLCIDCQSQRQARRCSTLGVHIACRVQYRSTRRLSNTRLACGQVQNATHAFVGRTDYPCWCHSHAVSWQIYTCPACRSLTARAVCCCGVDGRAGSSGRYRKYAAALVIELSTYGLA